MSKAAINIVALVGMIVARYALYIEESMAEDPTFSPFCDHLVSFASCSVALTGPYGHILSQWGLVEKGSDWDLSNASFGLLFYVLAVLPWHKPIGPFKNLTTLFLIASVASLSFSLYLAYILKFVLHEFCIICVSSYTINIAIFMLTVNYWKAQAIGSGKKSTTKKVE